MDKKMTAIVIGIVVIAVASIAIMTLTNSNDDGNSKETYLGGVLPVYGNANGDSVIDENDIEYLNATSTCPRDVLDSEISESRPSGG